MITFWYLTVAISSAEFYLVMEYEVRDIPYNITFYLQENMKIKLKVYFMRETKGHKAFMIVKS